MFRKPALEVIAAATVDAAVDGVPAKRLQLLPLGDLTLRDGRKVKVGDLKAAEQIIAGTRKYLGRIEMMVDYDHHSANAAQTGARAVAAGWCDPATLAADENGISIDVTWNASATAAIEARDYRYLSPHLLLNPDGSVRAIRCASLVNIPAIDELAALASTQETVMLNQIALALGLPETATEAEIVAAIGALMPAAEMPAAMAAAAATLGLEPTAGLDELLAAAGTNAKPDPAKFAPMSIVLGLRSQLNELTASTTATAGTAAVDALIEQTKIKPADRQYYIDLFASDRAIFDGLTANAVPIIADSAERRELKAGALTPGEMALCATMGLTPEQFLKAKDA